jgi:hypothetical protein
LKSGNIFGCDFADASRFVNAFDDTLLLFYFELPNYVAVPSKTDGFFGNV